MSRAIDDIPWQPRRSRRLYWLVGVGLLAANLGLLAAVSFVPTIGLEHGPMENLQALALVAAGILFLVFRRRGALAASHALAWALALFCLTFFLLEFDTRPFGIEPLTVVTNGTVRDIWLAVLWLAMAGVAVTRWRRLWAAFRVWLVTPSGVLMVIAGVFWLLSKTLEHSALADAFGPHFLEELMEINGALLMLLSAVLTRRGL